MTSHSYWYDATGVAALLLSGRCTCLTRGRLMTASLLSLFSTIFIIARQPQLEITIPKQSATRSRLLLTLHCCAAKNLQMPDGVVELDWYSADNDDSLTTARHEQNVKQNVNLKLNRPCGDSGSHSDRVEVAVGNGSLIQISQSHQVSSLRENSTGHRRLQCRRVMRPRDLRKADWKRSRRTTRTRIGDCRNASSSFQRHLAADNATNSSLRLPQCLIIGVRKGGTRALLEFLSLHPGVNAEKQEVHFFDDDWRYARGLDWYRQQMRPSRPDQITIEKTPAYFVNPRVPSRVRRMNESVKLLVIVRDPVERAISDYMQIHASRLSRGKFHASFERLVLDPQNGRVDRSYRAIWRSLYDRHMARWLRHFRLDQFHLVDGDKLIRNPVDELRKVEAFLGIEARLGADKFYLNRTRGFYCMRTTSSSPMALSDDVTVVGDVIGKGDEMAAGKCLSSSKGRPHPDIDGMVIDKLRQFFRQHNERFYKMVGVDFGWPV